MLSIIDRTSLDISYLKDGSSSVRSSSNVTIGVILWIDNVYSRAVRT
jgi:hypothetical protein